MPEKKRRVRPLLLLLLWVWVICMALVLDLFWTIDEFDGVRPRSDLYLGMRRAAHKMIGEPIGEPIFEGPRWRGTLLREAKTPEDVRAMVLFCETATSKDRNDLRSVALTADDPLCAGNAIRALGRLGAVANDRRMLALLDDKRARVRHELIRALGESHDSSAFEELGPLLRDDDAKARLLAIQAVGKIGGDEATKLLEPLVRDPEATKEELAFTRAALNEASKA